MHDTLIKILLIASTNKSDQITGLLQSSSFESNTVDRQSDLETACRHLESHDVDLVLFDLQMIDAIETDSITDSLEQLARLRLICSDVPIVVLTERVTDAVVLEILEMGAEDCLDNRELTAGGLVRAMNHALARGRLVHERIQLQKLVIEASRRERQRISQDLHDSVAQDLTGLQMMATSLTRRLKSLDAEATAAAQLIADGIEGALKQIRNIINGLMPVPVAAEGLRESLNQLCRQTEERTGILCELDCPSETLFDDNETATQVFRIAQESVNNAVKHAQAKRIVVRFEERPTAAVLQVIDDGIGFEANRNEFTGFGLRIMKHRCELIGANLRIYSLPGSGTVVHCSMKQRAPERRKA
jgi:signal transduction histidine kinase